MKKIQSVLTTILLVASSWLVNGQANFRCLGTTSPIISTIPSNPNPCGKFYQNFIPKPTDPNDTIDVNFIFFRPPSTPGIYIPSVITPAIIQTIVNNINLQWTFLDPPHLPTLPPATVLTDSKIRFRLKNLSLITDSMAYIYNSSLTYLAPYKDTTAIDVFWCLDTYTGSGCGGGGNGGQGYVRMGFCGSQTPAGIDGLLGHELGHALGLDHPFAGSPITGSDLLHGNPGYTPPVTDLNITEEIAVKDTARNCYPINDSSSNNIMSYNWKCRSYLSPEQIGAIKYLLRSVGPTNDFIKPNQSICDVNHTKDSTYTSNQNWNTIRFFDGDVIIDSNVTVTVFCDVWMRKNSKVIVKPGGKLVIQKNGSFQSTCDGMWKGIEVWGYDTKAQYLNTSTNLPIYQGMIEMFGGRIKNAIVGVTLGKRDSSGNPVPGTGGGIIQATDTSSFYNNSIGVEFFPYSFISRNVFYNKNISFFKTTIFNTVSGSSYMGYRTNFKTPYAHVALNSVYGIEFLGCNFNSDYVGGIPYGIKGVNSGINMQDYCTSISGNTCVGNLIRNTFTGLSTSTSIQYGIYLSSYNSYKPCLIDHVNFLRCSKGEIYLSNMSYFQITNCNFLVNSTATSKKYGIYSDNCTGYTIENNVFTGDVVKNNNIGMFINNSGPNANSIYNNTFTNFDQGLWAQNQNVDFSNGVGLKLNCNDFTNCKYDIGVQKGGRYATFVPNYTGVDFTQGIANTANDQDNVRNTYGVVSCNSNSENKFYANTSNAFNTSHGSFLGTQYHPTPQTSNSCSNPSELVDVIGTPPSGPKSSYCPSAFSPTFSSLMLNSSATTQRQSITSLTNSLTTLVDGGNTASLLAAINSGTVEAGALKNLLASKGPYLSDAVMIAFYNTNPPYGHDKTIHEINAPVSPTVYSKILSLNLPSGILNTIINNQNQNKLSARRLLEAKLNLANTQLGLILNEKIRRFVVDSTFNPVDSIINAINTTVVTSTIINTGSEVTNYELNLLNLYVSAGMYPLANDLIMNLNQKSNPPTDFIELQSLLMTINSDPGNAETYINETSTKAKLEQLAVSGNYFVEGPAKSLLAATNAQIEEEMLYPDNGSGARFLSTSSSNENESSILQLNSSVKIYPNPAQNTLFVEMENNNNKLIEIRDVTGKLMISQQIEYKGTINIQNLQNGVYFVNLVNETNTISTQKIIVIK